MLDYSPPSFLKLLPSRLARGDQKAPHYQVLVVCDIFYRREFIGIWKIIIRPQIKKVGKRRYGLSVYQNVEED